MSTSTSGGMAESTLLSCLIKPGLAPAAALDKLGFEPLDSPLQTKSGTMSSNCITPPRDSLNYPSPLHDSSPASPQELHFSDDIPELDGTCDGIMFAIGRPSQATLDMIQEGLDHIHADLTDLAGRSGQPAQQIINRFIKQYASLNPLNDWNRYSKYYPHFMEQELDRLRKTGTFSGTIDSTPCKCMLYGRFNSGF